MHLKDNIYLKKLIRWWSGKNLPDQHIYLFESNISSKKILRSILIHPVKRRIAKYYLILIRKLFGLKVIAITGSAGKTTTKEMIASILSENGNTIYSYANIDPVYNIPTTILKTRPWTKYLVLEYGIEYKGEMDFYLWLAKPDIGIITNIALTHTEFFDNEEGVFNEKSKLVKNIYKHNFAVLNYENKYLKRLKAIKAKIYWFNKDIKAIKVKYDFDGTRFVILEKNKKTDFRIPIIGRQFVDNTLAAILTAKILKVPMIDVQKGLLNFDLPKHRMKVIKHKSGAVILDDSYNNNPLAAKMAIDTIGKLPSKQKFLVFGDMLELGKNEINYHKKIFNPIKRNSINKVVCIGELSKSLYSEIKSKSNIEAYWAKNNKSGLKLVRKLLKKDSLILIKGSRSIGLDYIVNKL